MSLKKDILWRVGLVYIGILVFAFAVFAKVVYLQFFDARKWLAKEKAISLKDMTIEPYRGDILDSKGQLLATSIPYYDIRLDMTREVVSQEVFRNEIDSLALLLSRYFRDKSSSDYKRELQRIRNSNKRYYLFKKNLTFLQLKEVKRFPIFRYGKYKGGFITEQQYVRRQPYVNLATRTIGYLSKSERGNVVGIEGAFDTELKGVTGLKIMHKIAGGYWMPMNTDSEVEPKDGYDVVTTIDVALQDVAQSALYDQLEQHRAHHGCVVLMEVSTGEVKAIANLGMDSLGNYKELYNYAIGESTEPGSTFKLPVLMACMEDGYINLDDTIDTEKGQVRFYDKTIRDSHEEGYGKISVAKVFELSSNVGCAKIVDKYYKGREHKFVDRLYSFNLNKSVGFDIRGESDPMIKYPGDKYWSGISLPMMSHGYEVQMTPLQILTFYNAVANNGNMVRPRIVKEIRSHGMLVKKFDVESINPSICSQNTIRMAKIMLEGVVENGTAINLKNTHLKVAGKTGTAQVAQAKHGYRKESKVIYQASFCGYFPAERPKYSCIVVISAPSNSVYYGNVVAGPVFKEIAEKVYSSELGAIEAEQNSSPKVDIPSSKNGSKEMLTTVFDKTGIDYHSNAKRKQEWVSTHKDSVQVTLKPITIRQGIVPNVVGMSLRDGLYLLENMGLRVNFNGYGTIRGQSISPGQFAEYGDFISLHLSN